MKKEKHLVIVPGGLNIDMVGLGVDRIIGPGELTLGGTLKIGPGGKARNMAQMAAAYLGPGRVAMIGRTSKDPYGLWKIPVRSLDDAGVDTRYIRISSFEEAGSKYPGVALIPVDKKGKNQIYVLPGVNQDFCKQDVDVARVLFEGEGRKIMILALEIPMEVVEYCIEIAVSYGVQVILDPGGVGGPIDEMLNKRISLLKPNEHEARILTGISVLDENSAEQAARAMLSRGVRNIFLTCGEEGGYLFNPEMSLHIPCPDVEDTGIHDETGCGDQVTAVVASCLAEGLPLEEACRLAILAGTLQFYRAGIQPVTKTDLIKVKPDGEIDEKA
jgi:ribokinase